MQVITISGNIGGDAAIRDTSGGMVCSFNVGSKNGFARDAGTNWFRCSLWGKRAESLQPYLLKGTKVVVTGEFTTSEYEGKQQLNVRVGDVELMSKGEGGRAPDGGGGRGNTAPQRGAFDPNLDDDVPFISADGVF